MNRSDLPELVVDLTHSEIRDWPALWAALAQPCGLPDWFGRNLDAWWDTIQARQISATVDAHFLVINLPAAEFFTSGDGQAFVETTNESDFARAAVG